MPLGHWAEDSACAHQAVLGMKRLLRHPWLRRGLQLLVILVPLAYVVRSLIRNWQALGDYNWHFEPWRVAAALLALVLARNLLALASQQAFSGLGHAIGSRAIFRGYHISMLSMYLPGGLYVGRAIVFGEHGVDPISSSAGVTIELSMMNLAGMLTSVPYFILVRTGSSAQFWVLGLMLIPPILAILYPGVINRALRWLLSRVGYRDRTVNLTSRQLSGMLLLDTAYWLLAGAAFYLLVSSVYAAPGKLFLAFVSAYSLAGVAGILLSVTPGGLGVVEGALAFLLAPLLPTPLPALLAILARLWTTAALLILFALVTLLGRRLPRGEAQARGPLPEE